MKAAVERSGGIIDKKRSETEMGQRLGKKRDSNWAATMNKQGKHLADLQAQFPKVCGKK